MYKEGSDFHMLPYFHGIIIILLYCCTYIVPLLLQSSMETWPTVPDAYIGNLAVKAPKLIENHIRYIQL